MTLSQQSTNEVVICAVFFTLTTAAVALRFVTRRILRASLNASDWLTALSWFLLTIFMVEIFLWAIIGANGEEMKTIPKSKIVVFLKLFYANQLTYFVLSPCIKLSLVYLFRSLFPVRSFRIAADIVAALIITWGCAIVLAGIFQCIPVSGFWGQSKTKPHCINQTALLYGVQGPNIIFDFVLLFMPIPIIWKIQRPAKDKLAVLGVFSLGGLGCVSGIVRVVYLGTIKGSDITYTIYEATIWTLVEPSVALICGSLPVIRGLLRKSRRFSTKRPSLNLHYGSRNFHSQASKGKTTLNADHDREMGLYHVMVMQEVSVTSERAPMHELDSTPA